MFVYICLFDCRGPFPNFATVEGLFILLLSVNIAVGLLVLLAVLWHHRQWKRSVQPVHSHGESTGSIATVLQAATKPLSAIEKKYLALFIEGKTTEAIAEIMHVEPATVYTVKYRLRKKFPADFPQPF